AGAAVARLPDWIILALTMAGMFSQDGLKTDGCLKTHHLKARSIAGVRWIRRRIFRRWML
ncbi:MAG TPA: hypothetical protein VE396_16660, partial [Xanthobacteraceae bacterium]|nr:hypothetical protein [Xanthobacteraceae bacterium]